MAAELMDAVTCLCGVYLGAVVFELRTNEHDGVLHCAEQFAHVFTAVQVTRGQDGHGRCEKFLLQETRGGNENTVCVLQVL